MSILKEKARIARHKRNRKKMKSNSKCPRISVHRSLKNIYIQIVDDTQAGTLLSVSTLDEAIKSKTGYGGNVKAASALGQLTAEKLKQKGITRVIFDRGGYPYHGRVKAIADSLRKEGIIF